MSIARANTPAEENAGFALVEVIVATVIAIVAALGLAYSFSVGRTQIDRFMIARIALAAAQDRMERLTTLSTVDPDLDIGQHPSTPSSFVAGTVTLYQNWTVAWFDDPAVAGSHDLRQVTVAVWWQMGGLPDTLRLTRLFPR